METLILVVHVIAAAGVIGLVLLQHGKGADMGAAFGSGASGSLFGVTGSANLLSRATAVCVAVFFATSLTLAYMASHRGESASVVKLQDAAQPQNPAEKAAAVPADARPAETSAKDVPQ